MVLDLIIDPFDRVCAVVLDAMLFGEGHVGQNIGLRLIHDGGELGHLGADLVGDGAPLAAGGVGVSCAKAVAMKALATRRPFLPAWASTLRMTCTRQRCQVAHSTLVTAALMPSWASEITSLTRRRPRRVNFGLARTSGGGRCGPQNPQRQKPAIILAMCGVPGLSADTEYDRQSYSPCPEFRAFAGGTFQAIILGLVDRRWEVMRLVPGSMPNAGAPEVVWSLFSP